MKAAVIHEFGPADVLKIEDAADPRAAAGEVLVKVRAVRVGGMLDIGTRAGRNPFARLTFPHILGSDFAGDVVEVGEGFTGLEAGDHVAVSPFVTCGRCPACLAGRDYGCPSAQLIGVHRQGSYAEFVSAPAKVVRRIPTSLSYEQAAALALSGPVAFTQFAAIGLKPGDWVLVTAAASGLGLVTSLVAKKLGARVIATSRKDWKREMLSKRGFEAVLDTDDDAFAAQVGELTGGQGVAFAVDNTSSVAMFPKVCAALGRLGV